MRISIINICIIISIIFGCAIYQDNFYVIPSIAFLGMAAFKSYEFSKKQNEDYIYKIKEVHQEIIKIKAEMETLKTRQSFMSMSRSNP